jgi:hypothetical protein
MTGTALPRMLYGAATGLALAGLVFWVMPIRTAASGSVPDAPFGAPVEGLAGSAADTAVAATILEGNVLSRARRPPRTRLRVSGAPETAAAPAPGRVTFQARLFGTVTGGEPSALIDADPGVPGAEVYRPGDRLLGRRLTDISDSSVVLEGPSGRLVLRLERTRGPSR